MVLVLVLLARSSDIDHIQDMAQCISCSLVTLSSRFDTTKGGGRGDASIDREVSSRGPVK